MSSRDAPELAADTIARQRAKTRADILATFGGAAARDARYPDEAGAEHVIELACVLPGDTARLAYFREAPGLYRVQALPAATHCPAGKLEAAAEKRKGGAHG